MGGDTPAKLARAGVSAGGVGALLISHLHADHVSGLPDFLWGEVTAHRSRPLTVVGPAGSPPFPDVRSFFERLFGAQGAFADLHSVLAGKVFPLNVRAARGAGSEELSEEGLRVSSLRVDHGRIPALAFRVDGAGFSIVFAGDQTMREPGFAAFAAGATMLVAHAILTDAARDAALARVVATPEAIGLAAAKIRPRSLVLSHLMSSPKDAKDASAWSLSDIGGVIAGVRRFYGGRLEVASDLRCFAVAR